MERSPAERIRPPVWHVYWQAAPGRHLMCHAGLIDRIRRRLVAAHDRQGRELLFYLQLPQELHLVSALQHEDTPRMLAAGTSNVMAKWVRQADGRDGPVFNSRCQVQRVAGAQALRQEIRMLAWRPVRAGLQCAPTNYVHSALKGILGLSLPGSLVPTALMGWLGESVSDERAALRRLLAARPSDVEWLQWELTKGLAPVGGERRAAVTPSRQLSGAAAALVAASADQSIDGAIRLLSRWVEVTLEVPVDSGGSSARKREGARARALVAELAVKLSLGSVASLARHFGRAKATLGEQMVASRLSPTHQALLSMPIEAVVQQVLQSGRDMDTAAGAHSPTWCAASAGLRRHAS